MVNRAECTILHSFPSQLTHPIFANADNSEDRSPGNGSGSEEATTAATLAKFMIEAGVQKSK